MKLEVYHTTENRGNSDDLLVSKGVFGDTTELFLGQGYYYWESNYNKAVIWGQRRYKGNFYVFKGNFDFDYNKMFDISLLAHNLYIEKQFKLFKIQYKAKKKEEAFYLGLFIDFLIEYQNDLIR